MDVVVERGTKRAFAGAVDWPGYTRAGRDEATALDVLVRYGPRYAAALRGTRLGFTAPNDTTSLTVVAHVRGTATTDFGAPDVEAPADGRPVEDAERRRLERILRAAWRTFDAAVAAAEGVELAKGPRGGGRALDAIVDHVLAADGGYVRMIGGRGPRDDDPYRVDATRAAVLDAFGRAVREGVPPSPRGGKRWSPRYFVRRSAWHVLDHAWELEDRTP